VGDVSNLRPRFSLPNEQVPPASRGTVHISLSLDWLTDLGIEPVNNLGVKLRGLSRIRLDEVGGVEFAGDVAKPVIGYLIVAARVVNPAEKLHLIEFFHSP